MWLGRVQRRDLPIGESQLVNLVKHAGCGCLHQSQWTMVGRWGASNRQKMGCFDPAFLHFPGNSDFEVHEWCGSTKGDYSWNHVRCVEPCFWCLRSIPAEWWGGGKHQSEILRLPWSGGSHTDSCEEGVHKTSKNLLWEGSLPWFIVGSRDGDGAWGPILGVQVHDLPTSFTKPSQLSGCRTSLRAKGHS